MACTTAAKVAGLGCANCDGYHTASSKDYPKWKEETAIQRVRAESGFSYADAPCCVVGGSSNCLLTQPERGWVFNPGMISPEKRDVYPRVSKRTAHVSLFAKAFWRTSALSSFIFSLLMVIQVFTDYSAPCGSADLLNLRSKISFSRKYLQNTSYTRGMVVGRVDIP